jgi:tetratricopeptide (TPR) repeat protein
MQRLRRFQISDLRFQIGETTTARATAIENADPSPLKGIRDDGGADAIGLAIVFLVARVYFVLMAWLTLFFAALTSLPASAIAQQTAAASSTSQDLLAGVVISKVVCSAHAEQSYALYLPSNYTPGRRWPIVFVFDPLARGDVPVKLMKDAAERYGYIVAGSNNSQNGPWKVEIEAAQAMSADTQGRLAVDTRRVYFAGLSGGARFAAALAQRCGCAAGVLLNSAGFTPPAAAVPDRSFSVFATAGTTDFNLGEVVEMDAKLRELHYFHAFREFDGPHEWGPAGVMDEGLAWLRLMAMKSGREKIDKNFVGGQIAAARTRALNLETAGDFFGAWKEYRQAAETFDGLGDAASFRERAGALEKEKAVREGAKLERREFDEQMRLSADISSGLEELGRNSTNGVDARNELERRIAELRGRVEHEKNLRELRVAQRALAGIFIEAIEAGNTQSDAKNYSLARNYFELAVDASPDSAWALSLLAVARAEDGDRKGTFEALRRAKEKSKDAAAFRDWLNDEPALAKFRDAPEFRALIAPAQEPR